MSLTRELIRELIDDKVVTAVYGGGFKPPTAGHLLVVKKALEQFPEIDKLIIYVGGGVRDEIDQEESLLVWEKYKKLLPSKVEIQPSKAPIGDILRYGKNNPDEVVYFVIGARENNEGDLADIAARTTGVEEKYPNTKIKVIQTPGAGMSGTNARKALNKSAEDFYQYLPSELSLDDKAEIYNILKPASLNEGIISLTPEEESSLRQLVPIIIKGIKDRNVNNILTSPIEYTMASGEKATFRPYIYYDENDTDSAAHFRREDAKDFNDNLIGVNYNYYGPAFDGTLEKIWSTFTGDSPKENLLSSLRHELIHAKDPAANNHELKVKYDTTDPASYYGGWTEFPTQTGEFFEILKNRTEDTFNDSENTSKTAQELKFYFQDILDFYSGKTKSFDYKTWKWISGGQGNAFQRFIKNIASFGGSFLSPGWEQQNLLGMFATKIALVKQYNPEGYKEFQKDLYKLIQELIDKINSQLHKNAQISAGGTGSFKNLKEDMSFEKKRELVKKIITLSRKAGDMTTLDKLADMIAKQIEVNPPRLAPGEFKVIKEIDFVSLEKVLDNMFDDLDIDINFTKHFKERVLERGLTEEDIIELMSKIHDKYGDEVADLERDENRVFSNLRKLVDIAAVAGSYGDDYLKDLILKTAYKRKSSSEPEFKTNYSSPKLAVTENATYSNSINIMEKCAELTNYMIELGMPIEPVPAVEFVDGDTENAKDFFGKTAYYDPNEKKIVLYTEGRHPKDIVRSFAHEMIHHMQNLDGRLGPITTTNTQEDDHLNDIEAEANLKGTMTFRNWTDSLQEGLYDDTKNFDLVKQNPFDIKKLANKGIVFITKPGDGKGGVADPNWEGDASVLTLYNMDKAEPWMEVAVKNLMPQAIPYIQKDQDKLIYNGKYRQILWGIDKKGLNPKDFHLHENKDPFGLLDGLLNEGRYDKFVNQLSRLAFELIKDGHDVGRKVVDETFRVGPADEDPDIISDDFEFDFAVQTTYTDDLYKVDGGANAGFDDEGEEIQPLLAVKFHIPKNPDWQKVSFDIKDVVRHELEHLTQDGENVKGVVIDPKNPKLNRPGKQMSDDQFIRNMIDIDLLSKADYFKLEKEVDAMMQGLYFKAKKSKRPYREVIDDYLATQPINAKEKEEILNLWRSRNKALNLPMFESNYKLGKILKEEETEQKYKIFCDMDGVITDFDEQFKKLSGGIPPAEYEATNGKSAFWTLVDNGGVGFWVGMPWMPNGKKLWEYISKYNPTILSAPSMQNESRLGKRLWVRNNLNPKPKVILASAANKQNYSGTNRILIDDRPSNVEQWRSKGGIGILFISTEQTLKELQELGL